MEWLKTVWGRLKNWRTTLVGVIAGTIVILGWFEIVVTAKEVMAILVAIEGLVLLFAKD